MNKEIPCVSDELMKQVNRIFYHGPQRAKSHDQRFGQWLINKIRQTKKYQEAMSEYTTKYKSKGYLEFEKCWIETFIWNVENPEIYEMLKDYNE